MAAQLHRRWDARFEGMSRRDRQGCSYFAYLPDRLAGLNPTLFGDVTTGRVRIPSGTAPTSPPSAPCGGRAWDGYAPTQRPICCPRDPDPHGGIGIAADRTVESPHHRCRQRSRSGRRSHAAKCGTTAVPGVRGKCRPRPFHGPGAIVGQPNGKHAERCPRQAGAGAPGVTIIAGPRTGKGVPAPDPAPNTFAVVHGLTRDRTIRDPGV